MKRFFTTLLCVIASIMLITAVLIVSIEMFALNQNFFEKEYKKMGTTDVIGMNEDDLSLTTNVLLSYTRGHRESLDLKVVINDAKEEVFGEREKAHMVDVRALYISARNTRTVCLIAVPLLIIAAFLISGKKALKILCRSFLITSGAFLVIVAALTVYAVLDFDSFWTSFHHVFFTNDLWLLYPDTDVLIMMVPGEFFFDLVTRIIIRFVSIFFILNATAFAGLILYNKSIKRAEG